MQSMRCILGLLMLVMVFTVPAWADLSMDFESPTYTVGNLEGQDGWVRTTGQDPSSVQIVGGSVVNGLQSVNLISSLIMSHSISGQVLQDNSSVSATMKADSSDLTCFGALYAKNTDGLNYAVAWANVDGYFYVLNSTHDGWINTWNYYNLGDKFVMKLRFDYTNSFWRLDVTNITTPSLSFNSGPYGFSSPTTAATGAGSVSLWGTIFWADDVTIKENDPIPLYDLNTKIDFESPKYTAAALTGQDGWSAAPGTMVNTTAPVAGLQSLRADTQSNAFRPLTGQTFQDGTTLTAKIKIDSTGFPSEFGQEYIQLWNKTGRIYVGFVISEWLGEGVTLYLNEDATAWLPTGTNFDLGDVLEVTIRLYFTGQRWQLKVQSLANPLKTYTSGWVPFSNPTTPADAAGSSTLPGQLVLTGIHYWFDDALMIQDDVLFPDTTTLEAAKAAPEGSGVNCVGYVSALYDGWFNIEAGDRSVGIVIAASGAGLSLGQEVRVIGVIRTNDTLGERGIYEPFIIPLSGSKIIEPLAMTNKALGGGPSGLQAGVLGASGMNNVGLLVKTTGRVSAGLGGEYFALDDGSGVNMIAWYGGTHPAIGSYITATGTVSTIKDENGDLNRQLILTGFEPVAE